MATGNRIRLARERAGLSKAELARRCGVSHTSVGLWESSETRDIRGCHLLAVAEATRTSITWLIRGTGDPASVAEPAGSYNDPIDNDTPPEMKRAVTALQTLERDEIAIVLDAIKLVMKARRLRDPARSR